MAVRGEEVELLGRGIEQVAPSNGSFALNMLYRRGAWEVREGFGQVSEYCTTVSMPSYTVRPDDFGIDKHLGSHLFTTNTGHKQILSVFSAVVNSANLNSITASGRVTTPGNLPLDIYVVQIDDLTDGTRHEECLYRQTSRNHSDIAAGTLSQTNFGIPMYSWHGHYETFRDVDRQAWVSAFKPKPFFFHEYQDTVFFGNEMVGTWAYYPTHFNHGRRERNGFVTTEVNNEWGQALSESCRIHDVTFSSGTKNYPYFNNASLPDFVDMTSISSIAVYAADKTLYFSDPERPAAIIDLNFQTVPCDKDIVAVEELFGNLYIFTESETFVYRFPGNSALQSGGQFSRLSNNIGCVGPNAVMKVEGRLMWADKNGVYSTSGNFTIQNIGEPVERFFTDFMTNPLTSYYTESGVTVTTRTQPTTVLQADLDTINMAYCPKYEAVWITFPYNNCSLVYAQQRWSLWTEESIVYADGGVPKVGLTENITRPWVVADDEDVYLIGSKDTQTIDDKSPSNKDVVANAYYLLRYGRGGSIDRSVDDEDMRSPTGFWQSTFDATTTTGHLYYGKPWRLDAGYKFRGYYPTLTSSDEVYLVPLSMVVPETFGGVGTVTVESHFGFDSVHWEPITTAAGGTDVDFILPSERSSGLTGWGYGAATALSRVSVVGGNSIQLEFNSGNSPTPVVGVPDINANVNRKTMLMWLPFKRLRQGQSNYGINIQPVYGAVSQRIIPNGGAAVSPLVCVWFQHFIGEDQLRREDSVAQPVDWAYKSGHVGISGETLVKARGLFARILSHGSGVNADYIEPAWNFGLFNSILSTDRKGWMSQVVDHDGINADAIVDLGNKSTIRTRVLSSGTLVKNVFGVDGTPATMLYGSSGTTTGNCLIGDEQTSVLATSDSAKGSMFSYMVFGHVQVRAQRLKLESVNALIRPVANGRRRTGH